MRLIRQTTITPAMLIDCNVPEDDAPAWAIETAYVVGNQVIDDHKLYEALQNNTGAKPADNIDGTSPKWLDRGYVVRWKAFDQKMGTKISRSEMVTMTLRPGLVNTISLLDVSASTIDVTMTDPVEGEVYAVTIDLINNTAVVDWYSYFFAPIITNDTVVLNLPPYANSDISISINYPSGTAEAGTIVVGNQREIGITQFDCIYEITDYSKFTEDAFGNLYVQGRGYAKRVTGSVALGGSDDFDNANRELSNWHATPLVFVLADEGYSTLIVYGFIRSFKSSPVSHDYSTCSFELRGFVYATN